MPPTRREAFFYSGPEAVRRGGPAWPPKAPLLPVEYALRSYFIAAHIGNQNTAAVMNRADTQVSPYETLAIQFGRRVLCLHRRVLCASLQTCVLVCASTVQVEEQLVFQNGIEQNPVRSDVAVSPTGKFTDKGMVAVFCGELFTLGKKVDRFIERREVPMSAFKSFDVFFEARRKDWRVLVCSHSWGSESLYGGFELFTVVIARGGRIAGFPLCFSA